VIVALESLAQSLEWPDESVDVTGRALASIRHARRRRRWPLVAAAAVAVLVAAVPAAAHFLSFGGVRISLQGGVAPDLGTTLDLGAESDLPGDFPLPKDVGAPAAAYEGEPPGSQTVVWAPDDALPEVLDTGVGLLLTRFPGALERDLLEKRLYEGGRLEVATVGGLPAYWIGGAPHGFFFVDETGRVHGDRARLAGHALLWQRDGVTYRMESALTLDQSVRLAESMR
jgi:hypothetical protein